MCDGVLIVWYSLSVVGFQGRWNQRGQEWLKEVLWLRFERQDLYIYLYYSRVLRFDVEKMFWGFWGGSRDYGFVSFGFLFKGLSNFMDFLVFLFVK